MKTLSDIIKETFLTLNEKWNLYMCASTLQLLVSAVFLLFLPPFGFVVSLVIYALTSVYLANHNQKRFQNKQAKFEDIFSFQNIFQILTTKIIRFIQICFWSIFLIVPGILVAIDYSMTDFILAENPKLDSFEVLKQSTLITRKHRAKITTMFLLYCLLVAIIIMFACSIILIAKFFTVVPLVVALVSLFTISGILYLFVVLPFIKVSLVILYEDLKNAAAPKANEPKEKTIKKTPKLTNKNA